MDLSSGAATGVGFGPGPPPGCAETFGTKEPYTRTIVANGDLGYIMDILIGKIPQ
ncbi:MAG: hypothetical protein MUC83_19300 [Pirellula sp.]|nr:hypothetical protein [Pirellula sp.]